MFYYNNERIKTVIKSSERNHFLIIIENKNNLYLRNPFYIKFYYVLESSLKSIISSLTKYGVNICFQYL